MGCSDTPARWLMTDLTELDLPGDPLRVPSLHGVCGGLREPSKRDNIGARQRRHRLGHHSFIIHPSADARKNAEIPSLTAGKAVPETSPDWWNCCHGHSLCRTSYRDGVNVITPRRGPPMTSSQKRHFLLER